MRKAFQIVSSLFLTFCLCGLAWFVRTDTRFFAVEEMPILLNFPAGHSGLGTFLKEPLGKILNETQGKNIWSVDLKALREQLNTHVWIKDVILRRQLPSTLSLTLDIQEVAFLWKKKDRLVPVTVDGTVLELPEAASAFPSRPILVGGGKEIESHRWTEWARLVASVPDMGLLRKENISSVRFLENEGLTLNFSDRETTVHLGWKNISTKGLQILKVQEYLESQKQKARVIDGSFNKKVLVRLRKRS